MNDDAELIVAMAEATPGYSALSDSDKALRKNLMSFALSGLRAHGMEVVPVEPTDDMVKAALRGNPHAWEHNLVTEDFSAIYRSMVRAAGK